jgi:hypothetical protein
LIPQPGTLHQALTFEDIDLSEKRFGIKSHKRATFLEFMGNVLDKNDNVLTYVFAKSGTSACAIIVYKDDTVLNTHFKLHNYSYHNSVSNSWDRYTFRDYIEKMLSQSAFTHSVDYLHARDFARL